MRTIAIGDVHGCLSALQDLLELVSPQPEDTVVFLGDYVDRGPDSRGVIDEILELRRRTNVVTLLGNHDATMIAAADDARQWHFWMNMGGEQTFENYGNDWRNIPESHLEFLENLKRFWITPTHFFVHANYGIERPLREQPDWLLIWEHITGLFPPRPHPSGRIAILGHTAQKKGEILDGGHYMVIDTGCVKGGWLTAYCIETDEAWQTTDFGEQRYLERVRSRN